MMILNGLHRAARIRPGHIAVVCNENSRTWSEVYRRVKHLAGALHGLGINHSARVAILSLNSIEFVELCFAAPWVGAALVPLNTRLAVPELLHQLDDSGSSILFFDEAHREAVERLYHRLKKVAAFVYIGSGNKPDFAIAYEEMIGWGHEAEEVRLPEEAMQALIYTGGTTGLPKAVIHSRRNMAYYISCFLHDLSADPDARLILNTPLFHLSGLGPMYALTLFAATIVLLPSFSSEAHLEILARYRCTHTILVPTTISWMLDHPELDSHDLSSLKHIIYGTAPITVALLRRMLEKFPGLKFTQIYGQTEICGAISILWPKDHSLDSDCSHRLRSAGQPHFTVRVRIVDEEGKDVPAGTAGEIAADSDGVFGGYLNNPGQTDRSLRDGWLFTGDAGYMDEDGFLYITDRIKDMIVSGGENVASSEPENAIATHPGVAQVAVIGLPDEKWGERVHAVVVAREGYRLSAEEIIAHCREHIAGYKCPKSVDIRSEPLPLSGVGKVKKDILRKEYTGGISPHTE